MVGKVEMDEEMIKEMEAFQKMLNEGEESREQQFREIGEADKLNKDIINFIESENNSTDEIQKEENFIDKANYLIEEISNISNELSHKDELCKRLEDIKITLEMEKERELCILKNHSNSSMGYDLFFDISMVVEETDDPNIYFVKVSFCVSIVLC